MTDSYETKNIQTIGYSIQLDQNQNGEGLFRVPE